MDRWLKLVGAILVAIVAFWIVLQIVSIVFSFVAWVVSMAITLAILAVLLYLAYLVLSRLIGGSGNTSTTREREKIFE